MQTVTTLHICNKYFRITIKLPFLYNLQNTMKAAINLAMRQNLANDSEEKK